ncbi:hypothetical protein [Prosthecobacter sp.]|uniref:hypothetical protein n=1 Tax=Prosthecobacter sp. TaxID=1965333 RepID=UPI003783730A
MRRIEDFMNWLTDMDSGWWPVLSLRPPKDRDIDNRVLFKMSPVFGSLTGFAIFVLSYPQMLSAGSASRLATVVAGVMIWYLFGCVVFFVGYKFTFAYFWNRRARRLRSGQEQNEAWG